MQRRNNRMLSLVIGQEPLQIISSMNVLLVGAGGIGCEVAKNLSKIGIKRLTVLDFDTIDQTNLNRQFYFRKQHVGNNKAIILQQQIHKIDCSLDIIPLCENLYSKQFTDRFYQQFDLIISALDSIKAREHLAAQATRNGKPLVDAGTMGYNGQAYASIRFITPCHNCQPSRPETDTGAACLIRSRPQKPIHCATFAKNFYESFFTSKGETISDKLQPQRLLPKQYTNQQKNRSIAASVFRELFDEGISDTDAYGNTIESIRKLKFQQALTQSNRVTNPANLIDQKELYKQKNTLYAEQQLWSIKAYTERFVESMLKLIKRRYEDTLPSGFEKDDQDCMLLVCCITNLRTYNFINEHSQQNQLKYLTFYQCKDLIGRVMPAIASANSIAAALQIRQIVNIAAKKIKRMKVIHFTNQGEEKLSPCYQSSPLIDCNFCSQKIIYAKVQLDIDRVTFRELEEYCQRQLFSFGRDLYSGSLILIRNSKKTSSSNKERLISFFNQLLTDGVLSISFREMLKGTPISTHISIFHRQGLEGIRKIDTPEKTQLRLQLLRYFRKLHESNTQIMASDLRFYGGYEL